MGANPVEPVLSPLVDGDSSWFLPLSDRTALNPVLDYATGDSTGGAAMWNVRAARSRIHRAIEVLG